MKKTSSVNRVFLATVLISSLGYLVDTDNYLVLLLASQILLVAPAIIYFIINKVNIAKAIRFHKVSLPNIALIILFAFLIQPLMTLINAISMVFVQNTANDVMMAIAQNNSIFVSLFMVAFVPCIFEETVYRGVFYNEYRKVNTLKGILLSGFLFGIIHGNLNQFSYAFAMGIIFALLIEATDSIVSTMIVHFIINGTSITLLYLYPKLFHILENIYGKDKYNAKELMEEMQVSAANLDLLSILQSYLLPAAVSTIFAFIIFRTIAINTGRWEFIKGILDKNSNKVKQNKVEFEYKVQDKEPTYFEMQLNNKYMQTNNESSAHIATFDSNKKKDRLFSVSLIIAIIICIANLIVNEIFASKL